MLKGCLFDLDGTLVDSLEDLALATNEVLRLCGYQTHPIGAYNHFVGNGVRMLISRALPQDHQDDLDQCLNMFKEYYHTHCLDHTLPYEGMKDLIFSLKNQGIKLAVVTNKPHALAIKIVNALFPDCFDIILGQQDLYPVKPAPDSCLLALKKLNLSAQDCFFIGDSDVDIQTGYNASMKTIGVCWGFRGRKELEGQNATYVVDDVNMLRDVINENRS